MAGVSYTSENVGGGGSYGGYGGWGGIAPIGLFGVANMFGNGYGYGRDGMGSCGGCGNCSGCINGTQAILDSQTDQNIFTGNYALSGELANGFSGVDAHICSSEANLLNGLTNASHWILDKSDTVENAVNAGAYSNGMATMQAKYDLARAIDQNGFEGYQNTMTLDSSSGARFSNVKDILCEMQRNADQCCCETNQNILRMGYETQLRDTTLAYQTQLRDMDIKSDTDKQLCELKTGQAQIIAKIEDSEKNARIAQLERDLCAAKECNERFYVANVAARTNCLVDSVGDSLKANFGPDYPWSINACCVGGGLI